VIDENLFQNIKENGDFEILPCNTIADKTGLTKLELTSAQKIQVSALLQQLPLIAASGTMAQAYSVSFYRGMPHTLMQLKNGGVGSPIIGGDGRIAGSAVFNPMTTQAAVLGVFSVMSIASGQYFLSQINNELKMMKLNVDKILEFLYGDKKAELISEVSFAQYAYKNYSSIMEHDEQRVATIIGLQKARKVAMKDVEFYISDLDSAVNSKANSDIVSLVDKAFQIKECLEISTQLYIMSGLMEVYYAQNYDDNYISYIKEDMVSYISKCEKRMLSDFSMLSGQIHGLKEKPLKKIDKPALEKKVDCVVEMLSGNSESELRKSLKKALPYSGTKSEYYLDKAGDAYLKAS